MRLRTLVVDDHTGFRASVRVLLQMEGFDVVGEAGDGATALSAAGGLRPDLVLLDIQLPDCEGFEVAREILERGYSASIVLVSSRDASDYGDSVERSGALGFVPKSELTGGRLRALLEEQASCG